MVSRQKSNTGNCLISRIAESLFVLNEQGVAVQWIIAMHPLLKDEPFQTGSAFIAHEAMHQDTLQGQNEEIAGKSAEINTWKLHLLVLRPINYET